MLAVPVIKSLGGLGDTSAMISCLVGQNVAPEEVVRTDVNNLEQYRIAAAAITEPSEVGQQHLLRYCHQLKSFAPRFVGLEPQMKVTLTWSDAFGVSLKASASSFYFDLACCMWNLASFESLMGAKQDRTNEEGLRASNKHFQQAAGYLEHIRVHILPLLPPLGNYPCLSEDGLNMVKNLMLAQGQLCYYEKAVKDKKKDSSTMKASIVAKLAKQTSVYYHTTSIACKVGVLGSMLDISWFAVTDFQSKCFQGAAEYWQAHASKEAAQAAGTGYGEEVARFHRADTLVGLAIAQSSKFAIAEPLMFGANGLRAAIQQHRQTAEHDLKTVYMESVPNDYSLAEVGCVSMVRAMDVPEPSGAQSGALFRYVLPSSVRQANARYTEEIGGMYQSTQGAAESATNAARTALSAKGLPGSLEAAKTEDPLPPSLWTKVQRVQAMGGSPRLTSMYEDLKGAARRTLQSMATIEESLDREERTDDDFRRLNPHFPGTSSRVLSADVRANNTRMREAYRNAQSSDTQIQSDMTSDATVELLALVSKTREELLKLFPKDTPNLLDYDEHLDRPVENPDVTRLEEKLHELAALIEARGQDVSALQRLSAVDVTDLANTALSKSQDVAAVHAKNTQDGQEIQLRVIQGISKQDTLLNEIMGLNEAFCRNRLTNPTALERNRVIQQIEQSVAKFSLIHSQITAGITFYSSLQSKLTTLTQSADDLSYTQQWQRQDYGVQRSGEIERSTQELADRDYALKLSNELAAAAAPPAPAPAPAPVQAPVTAGYAAYQPQPVGMAPLPQQQQPQQGYQAYPAMGAPAAAAAPTQQPAVSKPNEMVYGTPVAGPPQNLVGYQGTPQPAAAQAAPAQPQYQAQYQQQYAPYGAAAAPAPVPAPAQNPAYNPNLYGAAPPPPGVQYAAAAPAPQGYYAPPPAQAAPSPYGAYPALPTLGQPQPGQPAPAPGGYQYNTVNYNTQQPAPGGQQAIAQMQPHHAPAPINPAEMHAKTVRLCEMGFPQDQVIAALNANSGNEEAALNSLLSGPVSAVPAAAPAAPGPAGGAVAADGSVAAAADGAVKPVKPSGLFGRMWGSK